MAARELPGALAAHFSTIVESSRQREIIQCKQCGARWTWPIGKEHTVGNQLFFLNHARSHDAEVQR